MAMPKHFRTPDIDIKRTRTKDGKTEKSLIVVLLDKIDEMIEKGIPLTKTKLSRETGIGGNSFKTYASIFDDTIDMLRMFELGTKGKEGKLSTVPNFDKIAAETKKLIDEHAKKVDILYELYMEIYDLSPKDNASYLTRAKQLEAIVDAFWGYLGETAFIHEAFSGVNSLDDIDHLINEKYKYNQTLRKKRSHLKKQIAKEREKLKSQQT